MKIFRNIGKCSHCKTKLKQNRIKLIIVLFIPFIPMVIIGHQYPVYVRVITLIICMFIMCILWLILEYSNK